MPISTAKKNSMIARGMELARLFANANRDYNSFREEFDAEDYGLILTTEVISASQSPGLTGTEFVDGVSAMDAISTIIETNKTNLYKLAL